MTTQARLFLMMVLQLAIWGAWAPKLFPYMGMLGFAPWQQSLVGSCWGIAALARHLLLQPVRRPQLRRRAVPGGQPPARRRWPWWACAFATSFWPFFACYLVYSLLYVPTLSVTNSIAFANLQRPGQATSAPCAWAARSAGSW